MIPKDRKALACAIALLLALAASGSASAFTITSLSGFDSQSYSLRSSDLSTSWWSDDEEDGGDGHQLVSYLYDRWTQWRKSYPTAAVPVPEPSAALVFGLGLFAASRFARRKR